MTTFVKFVKPKKLICDYIKKYILNKKKLIHKNNLKKL